MRTNTKHFLNIILELTKIGYEVNLTSAQTSAPFKTEVIAKHPVVKGYGPCLRVDNVLPSGTAGPLYLQIWNATDPVSNKQEPYLITLLAYKGADVARPDSYDAVLIKDTRDVLNTIHEQFSID